MNHLGWWTACSHSSGCLAWKQHCFKKNPKWQRCWGRVTLNTSEVMRYYPQRLFFFFFIHTSMNLKVYKTIKTFAAFLFDTKTQVFTTRLWSFIQTEEVHFMLWSYSAAKELCCCLTCINETGSACLSFWLKWLTPLLLKKQGLHTHSFIYPNTGSQCGNAAYYVVGPVCNVGFLILLRCFEFIWLLSWQSLCCKRDLSSVVLLY